MPKTHLSDEYVIGEVLGVGTVGTIYRAINRQSGQPVAIKKLHPNVSVDRLIRARFRREMLVMDRLHHPNVVRCFGGGEDDGLLYYVMELIDGGTVKDLLENDGALDWTSVIEIGRQLCSALQFIHNHGVVHRDLKPSNLFLTQDGTVKLGDFGIARDLENQDITSSGMTVGTHAYMAPEQIRADREITGKADLYSLGCCLFELLTGQTPFQGDNFAQLFEQHLRSDPPRVRMSLSDCPVELDQIIQQMLAKKPEDRPFNARRIQAVMICLGDGNGATVSPTDDVDDLLDTTANDVGSDQVSARGRELLRTRIQRRLRRDSSQAVSWISLVTVLALVGAVIAVATLIEF